MPVLYRLPIGVKIPVIINNISAITTAIVGHASLCYAFTVMKPSNQAYDGANIEWEQRSVRSQHVTFGQVRYQPGGYCGPRVQRDYQLALLYSGSCEVRVDACSRTLRVGEAHLFRPGRREHFVFDGQAQTHHFWCAAAPDCLPRTLRQSLDDVADGGHTPSECFTRLVSAAFLLRPAQAAAAWHVVDTLAAALFSEFLNMAAHATATTRRDVCVTRALRHMEDNLADSDCLPGAQRAAGCSVNALIYKFAAAVGAPPARHLWRLRAEKGLELLTDTGLSVAEIADQCGFKNPFHFSRSIRRLQGRSPREVRRLAWGDADANPGHGHA